MLYLQEELVKEKPNNQANAELRLPTLEAGEGNMIPFDEYPEGGRVLLGQVKGANCRHEYGLQFMQKTGQTKCAYCGSSYLRTRPCPV